MRLLACALVLATSCVPSFAQYSPKAEVFGGFSYLNYEAVSVNLPSGTETTTVSCPSGASSSGDCTTTTVGPSNVNFNPQAKVYCRFLVGGVNKNVTASEAVTSNSSTVSGISSAAVSTPTNLLAWLSAAAWIIRSARNLPGASAQTT